MASREPLESVRTRAILGWLNRQPRTRAVKYHGSEFSNRGEPDIFACIDGEYWAFEVKRTQKEVPSKIQLQRIAEIRAAGGRAYVVYRTSDVIALVKERYNEGST